MPGNGDGRPLLLYRPEEYCRGEDTEPGTKERKRKCEKKNYVKRGDNNEWKSRITEEYDARGYVLKMERNKNN